MTALSLMQIGELKSLAERDAKTVMKDLLDRRKAGQELSENLIRDFQAKSLTAYLDEKKIGLPGVILKHAEFYGAEFNRQLEALWDVLAAASGVPR